MSLAPTITRTAAFRVALGALALGVASCGEDTLRRLGTKTDEFTQNAASQIDILWVVDNSGSMGEEQQGLGESFAAFIETLVQSSVDYHIGVISTDPASRGVLNKGATNTPVITPQTANAATVFLQNVRVGTSGSASERAFENAALALGKGGAWEPGDAVNPPNAGFLREAASLFIIMVSDEDDQSFGPVSYYRRLFKSYKGPGNEGIIKVSAIVSPSIEDQPCYDAVRGSAVGSGKRFGALVAQTGGIETSICSDFTESLGTLSITAAGLKSKFQLAGFPSESAAVSCDGSLSFMCVRVDGTPVAKGDNRAGWTLEKGTEGGQSVAFVVFGVESIPKPQQKITVEYQDIAASGRRAQ